MTIVKRFVYVSLLIVALAVELMGADEPLSALWDKFEATRASGNLHQEFEVTERVGGILQYSSAEHIVLDFCQNKWREHWVNRGTQIFDGHDLFLVNAEETEYTRVHRDEKEESLPEPYALLDWGRAKELERLSCGLPGKDHTCVIIEAPIKPWVKVGIPGKVTGVTNGWSRIMIDTETGIWLRLKTVESVGTTFSIDPIELTYTPEQMSYGTTPDATLFKLSDGLREVEKFTPRDASQINELLAGKPAPEFHVNDLQGQPISLASLKGKAVLLFFFPPFLPGESDAPSIEWLSRKYANDKNVQVIGISMAEDRDTVEKYLKKHRAEFPIVLSSENTLPRPYLMGRLPFYIVIAPDGTFATSADGEKGYGRVRKVLDGFSAQTK